MRARGHFPTEQAAPKCLYLVTRSLDRPDTARHAGSPDASMTTAIICARLSPAPAARRSTATKPTVTPPTTKPARHRYPSSEAKTAPITWNQTSQTSCQTSCLRRYRQDRLPERLVPEVETRVSALRRIHPRWAPSAGASTASAWGDSGALAVTGIALQHRTQSLNKLARMLQVACYVVIAFLSGMGDVEHA
jgi:hypothetical protein